ncbi:glutamine--fructose-6-phosphate transaminase (isomerizing) [Candidatus Micrarchaeota archaeon]|nr:glutamine--fructose-6-phosphate transaminase (isomerizing) [Candidatus Micrarchaeota archaeon]
MCGIIGYIGMQKASTILIEGLKSLEYRGYDSVGIATLDHGRIRIRKNIGMVSEVADSLKFEEMEGTIGIGHTRWATHGVVSEENAHPHFGKSEKIAAVHNGVIENFAELREEMKDHRFRSETDSELIPHLIEEHLDGSFIDAFIKSLKKLEGSYAVVAVDAAEEKLYLARKNSPLVIGIGKGEMFCASDIPAMLKHTRQFVPLEEGDIAILTRESYQIFNHDGKTVIRKPITVKWSMEQAQKSGFPHFMLKEIHEQKHTVSESLAANVDKAKKLIENHERIDIVACGTSYHAGLMLAYLLSKKGKNAHAYIASDYPFIAKPDEKTLMVAISQSGETADILQAIKAKSSGKIAITNAVGSSIARICDATIYMNAGPEVGVAATKTFTAQLAIVFRLAYEKVPEPGNLIETMLSKEDEIRKIAEKLSKKEHAFFLARGSNVPIAYEGSLKFKEITYIHSEAYPAGELKHGTLSLVTEGTPVIALAPKDETTAKLLGNIKETKARGATVISLTNDANVKKESDYVIDIPVVDARLYPLALAIPLQLLAYHVSVLRGINPDRPRNLAKSVTVE